MPTHRETRLLPYRPEQMYRLVADVARYPEFLPWVVATRIRSDDAHEMIADMVVGFKQLRERFTSRVRKTPERAITVEYLDGPLKNLENSWTFEDDGQGGCQVEFYVAFAFKNRLFETLAGQYFDKALRKMVGAFEERAAALYGNSSSSAESAAR